MSQPPKKGDDKDSRLPPALKSKMDFDEEPEDSGVSPWLGIGMIAAIVVLGAFLAFSITQRGKKDAAEEHAAASAAAEEREEEPALPDSAAMDSIAAAKAAATPPKPAEKAPEKAPAVELAPTPEPSSFGIQVGSYLFEDRANEVLTALTSSASVQGRVVPGDDGSFAVVLGPFDSRGTAEAKGTELLSSGAVSESRVVTLKE